MKEIVKLIMNKKKYISLIYMSAENVMKKFVPDTVKQAILDKFGVFVEKIMVKLSVDKQTALTALLLAMQARFNELALDFTEADLKAMLLLIKEFVAEFNLLLPKLTCKLLKFIKKMVKLEFKLVLLETDKLYRCVVKIVYTSIMKLLGCLEHKYDCMCDKHGDVPKKGCGCH